MYRINLILLVLFLSTQGMADTSIDAIRAEFITLKAKLLKYDFKPEAAQKAFGNDLARLEELRDQARLIFRRVEKDTQPTDQLNKAINQMSLELSLVGQLDLPVATGFTPETCVNAHKDNEAAKNTHEDLYKSIKTILDVECAKHKDYRK